MGGCNIWVFYYNFLKDYCKIPPQMGNDITILLIFFIQPTDRASYPLECRPLGLAD